MTKKKRILNRTSYLVLKGIGAEFETQIKFFHILIDDIGNCDGSNVPDDLKKRLQWKHERFTELINYLNSYKDQLEIE